MCIRDSVKTYQTLPKDADALVEVLSKQKSRRDRLPELSLIHIYPGAKSQGIKQLMAGGGVVLIGTTLIPLLSGLFG